MHIVCKFVWLKKEYTFVRKIRLYMNPMNPSQYCLYIFQYCLYISLYISIFPILSLYWLYISIAWWGINLYISDIVSLYLYISLRGKSVANASHRGQRRNEVATRPPTVYFPRSACNWRRDKIYLKG